MPAFEGERATDGVSLSFRDPAGRLLVVDNRVLRLVTDAPALAAVREALALDFVRQATLRGRLVRTRELPKDVFPPALSAPSDAVVLEHDRVPFPSHPYEWPPEMLVEAGRLTLDLARGLLPHGFGLKDATPYNILYRGPEPVFVDLLSIERRNPRDPTWQAYAQFNRTFLAPLLAHRAFGLRLDALLLTRRDGLEPEDLYRLAGRVRRLFPPFLTLATLPTWLARARRDNPDPIYAARTLNDTERARFVLTSILDGLGRRLLRLAPRRGARSVWSDYESDTHYSARDRETKTL